MRCTLSSSRQVSCPQGQVDGILLAMITHSLCYFQLFVFVYEINAMSLETKTARIPIRRHCI